MSGDTGILSAVVPKIGTLNNARRSWNAAEPL